MFEVNLEEREILLYDNIGQGFWGPGVMADDIHRAIEDLGDGEIKLRIASAGGDTWEALRMFNKIAEHGYVVAFVDAVAASCASYLPMAARYVTMAENSLMMIHGPWTVAGGNAKAFRGLADTLEKHGQAIAKGYAAKSGKTTDEIMEMFSRDEDVWLEAEEAVEHGFADAIGEDQGIIAKIDARVFHYRELPQKLQLSENATVAAFTVDLPKPPQPELVGEPFARRAAAMAKIAALAEVPCD